ncbi:MAG: PAS domain S-box protein [Cyanobacteria bacterium SZAS-4]|nr:PAS domain S-box protein [Cyanobacteria bacterium SZAS-4]
MNLRIWQKILILMLIPLSFEVAATAFLVQVLSSTQKIEERFRNSRKVLSDYHVMQNHFNTAAIDIATLGVYRKDGSPPDFQEDKRRIQLAEVGVKSAANIHPNIQEALNMAPAVFEHAIELIDKAQRNYEDPTIPRRKKGSILKNEVFSLLMESDPLVKRMVDVETSMDTLESLELEKSRWQVIVSASIAFIFSLLISLFVGFMFYRNFVHRLQLIEANAEKVALGQALPEALSGGDEIDELDRTLHSAAQFIESVHQKEFAVLNKSVDVLCSIDNRFRIISIGESVENSWFYKVGDVLGRSIFTLLPENDAAKVRTVLNEVNTVESERDFETELNCGDGQLREFAWKVRWNEDEDKFYCVLRDISERKKVERAKQRLLAIASHDLRTPLMSVSANLTSLAAGRFGELDLKLRTALTKSEQDLDKLMDLIQSLLDLERMESTNANLELSCVSALDATLEAISTVETRAREGNVLILPPSNDDSILADSRRFTQIVTNLLQNALERSSPNQKIIVSISSDKFVVRINIVDQGSELAADELELVFEKYFQPRNDVQKKIKSQGLSLALAKVLTEAQNASIGVTSEPGKGCNFYVQFPRFILNPAEDRE